MARKITATVSQEPVEAMQAGPTPAQRQILAERALRDTQQRLDEIAQRLTGIEAELVALEADVARAHDEAQRARDHAEHLPDAIHSARARLLIAHGTPAETSARAALAEVEADLADATVGAKDADVRAARVEIEDAARRAVLVAERDALSAERAALAALIQPLEREVAQAREARGAELLAAARDAVEGLLAAQDEARARLSEAEAAVSAHRTQTAEQLRDYPAALAQVRDTPLAVPVEPSPAETLIAARIAYLDALTAAAGKVPLGVAGVPLHAVLRDPDGMAYTLQAGETSRVHMARLAAERWIDAAKVNGLA